MRYTLAISCLLLLISFLPADGGRDKVTAEAKKAVEREIADLKPKSGPYQPPRIEAIEDQALAAVLPKHVIVSALFPEHPLPFPVPEPLKYRNLYFQSIQGKERVRIDDVKKLEEFYKKELTIDGKAESRKQAVTGWLKLTQILHNDGGFQFKVDDDSLKVDGETAKGKLVATRGGNGEIRVTLNFDKEGKLTSLEEKVDLKQGMRPICQSTKLLDPDPLVRRMAEQALLVMGRPALPYLERQRESATPELRAAIDAIRAKILQEAE